MSGIYQKQTNSGSVASPSAGRTLISVNESGELFTKDSSGAVTVYGSGSGGGGGAAFPFTGSADISGTLNVDFTDALSFITNDNILFSPIARLSDGEGGWVDLSFSGSVLGSIITGSNYVIRDYVGDGDTIVPAIGSFPTRVSAQTLNIPHISGSGYSGSVSGRIVGYLIKLLWEGRFYQISVMNSHGQLMMVQFINFQQLLLVIRTAHGMYRNRITLEKL
jgi:hypothetical protein